MQKDTRKTILIWSSYYMSFFHSKISIGQHQCSQWLEDISVNWASNESKAPSPVAAAVWTGTNVGHHRKEEPKKRKIKIENRYKDWNKVQMTITTFASRFLSFNFNKTGQQWIWHFQIAHNVLLADPFSAFSGKTW